MTKISATIDSTGFADTLDATAGLLPATVAAPTPTNGRVLTVGVGRSFTTLAAAIAASHDGDAIRVDAGTYTNDFATITTKITIVGVGGMVNLVATTPPPNAKGILTVDNDVTIENVAFSGSAVSEANGGNGAGIRYEGGQMVLVNDQFSDNQDGILAFPVLPQLTVNTITIDHSVFSDNGSGTGYTHNLYVGAVTSLTVTNSIFEGAVVGHEFKSRALANDIEDNIFSDGPTGTASYDIDLPNGGMDVIKDNLIEKGPDAENDAMIHFGGEGIPYAGSSLLIEGNSFVNDKGAAAVALLNQTTISATINGNAFTSITSGQIVKGPATGTGNTDGAGHALADIAALGVLPGNTTVYTDGAPHTIVLSQSGAAVQGGGGLLTVNALAGHVVAIGGAGGMVFTEGPASGGNVITTQANSPNLLTVIGQDQIDSEGGDTIFVGAGNITGTVGGKTSISDGTGNDSWTINGAVQVAGHGGNPVFTLGAKASLSVTGPVGSLQVQDNGGALSLNVIQAGAVLGMSMTGGAALLRIYNGAMIVTTAGGVSGVTLNLGAGAAQVTSAGPDAIWTGSGAASIIVSGRAVIHAGTGPLAVYGRSDQLGATVFGNGGTTLLAGDTGNITYYGGALASEVDAMLSNNRLVGGTGRLTVIGGSRETITGGSGGLSYAATDGGGANTITTTAGAKDTLTLAGADVVNSWGFDTIYGGSGNQSMVIHGNAAIFGSTGNSTLAFYGTDTLIGSGQDFCTVNAGANVAVTAGRYDTISETAATVSFAITTGANAAALSVTGGSAVLTGGTASSATVTTASNTATRLTIAQGVATATLNGADTVQAGNAGLDTVFINAANTSITGGAGSLAVHNNDGTMGDRATVVGGSGALHYDQGGGALTFVGGAGAAVIDGGWGSVSATGGSGSVTLSGGQAGLHFIAGSGQASVSTTSSGADITFGQGATSVNEASWGQADIFRFTAGSGGGTDVITGFRSGVDQFAFQGVSVASRSVAGGSTLVTLTDGTHLQLAGVTASHIPGLP